MISPDRLLVLGHTNNHPRDRREGECNFCPERKRPIGKHKVE